MDRRLPSKLSCAGTMLILFSALLLFVAAVRFAGARVVEALTERQDQFR